VYSIYAIFRSRCLVLFIFVNIQCCTVKERWRGIRKIMEATWRNTHLSLQIWSLTPCVLITENNVRRLQMASSPMAEWMNVTDFNTEGLRRSQKGVRRGLSFAWQHGLRRLPFARAERCKWLLSFRITGTLSMELRRKNKDWWQKCITHD
jgi:hypothetical protein